MSFADWSPSHLILVAFAVVAFIGNVAIMFYRIGQNDKKIDKHSETIFHAFERLEERMDKRFVEVIGTMNKRIDEVRAETNHRFVEVIGTMNQRFDETNKRIDEVRAETNHRFTEMNQRLSDIEAGIRQMNQNHINHLTHHGQNPPRANDS